MRLKFVSLNNLPKFVFLERILIKKKCNCCLKFKACVVAVITHNISIICTKTCGLHCLNGHIFQKDIGFFGIDSIISLGLTVIILP